jgi:type IX secretion system PorP/SprF family membrane protein
MLYQTRLVLLLGCWLCAQKVQAQDPQFSQFHAVRSYLNPAMVGLQSGISLNVAYRNQWFEIPGGFRTFYGALEVQEPNLNSAFGLSVFHDAEGQASLITQRVAFTYNYFVSPNLQIGLEPSVTRKFLDWKTFVFPDQLDPIFGVTQTSVAIPVLDQTYTFDMGVGAAYRGDLKGKHDGRYLIGIAAHHLWPWREESLQNLAAKVPTRITIHGGIELPITRHHAGDVRARHLTWLPSFKYEHHNPFQVLTLGCHVIYENAAYIGFFHQHRHVIDGKNTNALTLLLGYKFEIGKSQLLDLGFNYDANGTGLSLRSGGVFEMTMNINFQASTLFSQGRFATRKGGIFGGSGMNSSGRKRILDCKSFF